MKFHEMPGQYSFTVDSQQSMSVSMNWVAYKSAIDCHNN